MRFTDLKFIDGYSLEDFDKVYTRGYSKTYNPAVVYEKGEEGFPILVSKKAMEHYGLELGDKIFLQTDIRRLLVESYGTIVGTFKGVKGSKDYYGYSTIDEEELFIKTISP